MGLFVPTLTPLTLHWYEGFVPPLVGVALKFTVVPGQMVVVWSAAMETEGVNTGFTTMVIGRLVAATGEAQSAFEVISTVTKSPLFRLLEEKEELFVPTFDPFTFHWYAGALPPFTTVAEKLTVAPAQMLFAEAEMVTAGVTKGLTVMVMILLVVVAGQMASEVTLTVTLSVFANAVDEKVEPVAPETSVPLICHWKVGLAPALPTKVVKLTLAPLHIVFPGLVVIETVGVIIGLMVTEVEAAAEQPLASVTVTV